MKIFDSINVIPFIDIMLVLLAIVLTSATFISKGQLDITLPTAKRTETASNKDIIQISLDRNESLFVNKIEKSWNELEVLIKSDMTQSNVVLEIDKSVQFESFVKLADLIKPAAVKSVTILTAK